MLKSLFGGAALTLMCTSIGFSASVSFKGVANGVFSTGVSSANVVISGGSVDPHYTLIHLPTGCAGTAACSEDGTLGNSFGPASYVILSGYPVDGSTWLQTDSTVGTAGSAWIGPRANQNSPVVGAPIGNFPNIGIFASGTDFYVYRMVFNLTALGLNPGTAAIDLNWVSDNNTNAGALSSHIRLCSVNSATDPVCGAGNDVPNSGNLGQSTLIANAGNKVQITSGFTGGLMALDFIVYNSLIASGNNPSGLDVLINSATASNVPEPATFSLIAAALLGVGFFSRRK